MRGWIQVHGDGPACPATRLYESGRAVLVSSSKAGNVSATWNNSVPQGDTFARILAEGRRVAPVCGLDLSPSGPVQLPLNPDGVVLDWRVCLAEECRLSMPVVADDVSLGTR